MFLLLLLSLQDEFTLLQSLAQILFYKFLIFVSFFAAAMETIYQSFQLQDSNSYWTREENKLFEQALAYYDKNTADRWEKVAEMLPGKSVNDVINQYKVLEDDVSDIEAGLFPTPHGYCLDFDERRNSKLLRSKSIDLEKKKGVPWTQEEHRKFLMGLLKHGKGDWRSISRNFVITKTSTQVASHAQKYFLRLNSVLKDNKRRPSIHDITTTTLTNTSSSSLLNASFKGFESDYSNLLLKSSGYEDLYGVGEYGIYNGSYGTMFEVESATARQGIIRG